MYLYELDSLFIEVVSRGLMASASWAALGSSIYEEICPLTGGQRNEVFWLVSLMLFPPSASRSISKLRASSCLSVSFLQCFKDVTTDYVESWGTTSRPDCWTGFPFELSIFVFYIFTD